MINVLWIDDQPNEAFIDLAYEQNINIENTLNVDEGIRKLLDPNIHYDAIILDANCVSHSDGCQEPDIAALSYALLKITENKIDTPWFVYSGGGFSGEIAIDIIVKSYERNYDTKLWYKKAGDMNALFTRIKEVVQDFHIFQLKKKHSDIFSWYPNQEKLIDILLYQDQKKTNDSSVFNKIRKELDWLMGYCYECGLLLEPYKGSNLSECSRFIGSLQKLIPLHIKRMLHSISYICNEGSHKLEVDKLVSENCAPYLVEATIQEFLNILYWAKDLPQTKEDREQLRYTVERIINPVVEDYEGQDFDIDQDDYRNYHCGKCLIAFNEAKDYLGLRVRLRNVIPNNNPKTKDIYPFFTRKFDIVEI